MRLRVTSALLTVSLLFVVPAALAGGFVAGPNGAVAVGPKGGAVAVRAPPPPPRPPTVVVVRPPPPPVVIVRPPLPPTVVVVRPPMGTIVIALPPACSTLSVGGVVYQNCGGVYYRAQFQGTQLVYAVVPLP